jgi:hypothetical protein
MLRDIEMFHAKGFIMLRSFRSLVLDCHFCSGSTTGQNTQVYFPPFRIEREILGFPHPVEKLCETCALSIRKSLNESLGTD